MARKGKERNRRGGASFLFPLIIIIGVVAVIAVLLVKLFEQEKPQLSITSDFSHFGASKTIDFTATDGKSGIQNIEVFLSQGSEKIKVYEKNVIRAGFIIEQGPERLEDSFTVQTKSLGLSEGRADLHFTIRDFSWWNWMKGNEITLSYPTIIDTEEPRITIQSSPRYVKPGGAGVVVYKANEEVTDHGVTINGYFYPGYPLSEKGGARYVAYIGIPFDTERFEGIQITAKDKAKNEGFATFGMILRKAPLKLDRINVSDNFLRSKLPEIIQHYPEVSGSDIEKYIFINNKVRALNYETIQEVCRSSIPQRLWQGRFSRLSRSSRRAGFAEHRTYYYNDRQIDKQHHLGIDLASVRHAEVKAANRAQVAFADNLGIYGNTVILDHGQGVFSLYSHLSQIKVQKDDRVNEDTVLGLTGTSGLAGGDHLHFSMIVNGIFVDPLEWWDSHWLKVNILSAI